MYAAAACFRQRLAGEILQGLSVENGRGLLFFPSATLVLAFQKAPHGLWQMTARPGTRSPAPSGQAAFAAQHLRGFHLDSLNVPWADRILRLDFRRQAVDRKMHQWTLIAECFGGHGALLLLDGQEQIRWSSRWDGLESRQMRILPGATYHPPDSPAQMNSSGDTWLQFPAPDLQQFFFPPDPCILEGLMRERLQDPCAPWYRHARTDRRMICYPIPIPGLPGQGVCPVEEFLQWEENIPPLLSAASSGAGPEAIRRMERRIERLRADLRRWESVPETCISDAHALFSLPDRRHDGGLVKAADYRIDGIGERSISVPSGNFLHAHAQELLKKGRRAERGRKKAAEQLQQAETALQHLRSGTPANPVKPDRVRQGAGQGRKMGSGIEHREIGGFEVLLGRNAKANDWLTFRTASPQDLWFHVQDHQGSHVIVRRPSGSAPVPDSVLLAAAQLALQHSTCQSLAAEVDWTEVRHLSRHPQGRPGQVLYRRFQTLRVRRPGSGHS